MRWLLPETWGFFCMKNFISTIRNCHSHRKHTFGLPCSRNTLVWLVGPGTPPRLPPFSVGLPNTMLYILPKTTTTYRMDIRVKRQSGRLINLSQASLSLRSSEWEYRMRQWTELNNCDKPFVGIIEWVIPLWSLILFHILNLLTITFKLSVYNVLSILEQIKQNNNMIVIQQIKLTGSRVKFMVFIATFNNISAISWRSVLLVKETGLPTENHRSVASHLRALSHNVV